MEEGGYLVLIDQNRQGWKSLSRLITACHLEEQRLYPLCNWDRLERHTEGLLCLTGGDTGPINRALIRKESDRARSSLDRLAILYGKDNLFIEIERSYLPWEKTVNDQLLELAADMKLTSVAGGQITHSKPEHFVAQDTLVCIESLCLIDEIVGRKPVRDLLQPQI